MIMYELGLCIRNLGYIMAGSEYVYKVYLVYRVSYLR